MKTNIKDLLGMQTELLRKFKEDSERTPEFSMAGITQSIYSRTKVRVCIGVR